MIDNLINDSGLGEIDKNLVYGDIMYLADSGLVKGNYMIVVHLPSLYKLQTTGLTSWRV